MIDPLPKYEMVVVWSNIATICGIDAITYSTEQLRVICSSLKLSGYRSKPKLDLLRIIAFGKIHQLLTSEPKPPAKTWSCSFCLMNILFSDDMSPMFVQLGVRKDKSILDSGLAGNDEYFWQEVAEKFQEKKEDYDNLAHEHTLFLGIDPSVKLQHGWSKLRDIFKSLSKSYREVFENFKKSGNHDDFINFCGSKADVYYLYLWLQKKPQLTDLPDDVFFDSAMTFENTTTPQRSPTESESSFQTSLKFSLAANVNALVEERRKSREFKEHFHREPDQLQSRLNKEKLEMQISCNLDDNINRLFDIKRKLRSKTNPGIIKVLKKYEKRLTKAIGMSSSSENDSE